MARVVAGYEYEGMAGLAIVVAHEAPRYSGDPGTGIEVWQGPDRCFVSMFWDGGERCLVELTQADLDAIGNARGGTPLSKAGGVKE